MASTAPAVPHWQPLSENFPASESPPGHVASLTHPPPTGFDAALVQPAVYWTRADQRGHSSTTEKPDSEETSAEPLQYQESYQNC